MTVIERIKETYLVPVVVLDDAGQAADTARALAKGGVDIMEITLRTAAGLPSIAAVAERCPDVLVGAGTVLSPDACKKALDAGARFIVSPGLDQKVVEHCQKAGVAVLPGCVTPTEITRALDMGLRTLKFFPANIYGGIKAIKALSGPFPMLQFVPTGGVDASNLPEYVVPQVAAVGGGWLCDKKLVNAGDWDALAKIAAEARGIVKQYRK